MATQLKDVLHLYLGCEVIGSYNDAPRKGYLTGVTNGGTECEIQFFDEDGLNVFEHPEFNTAEQVRLVSRPLSSMTEEDARRLNMWAQWHDAVQFNYGWDHESFTPENTVKLLKQGFDLFNLIESGQAVDASTIDETSVARAAQSGSKKLST
jgi:hypothetical protein